MRDPVVPLALAAGRLIEPFSGHAPQPHPLHAEDVPHTIAPPVAVASGLMLPLGHESPHELDE